mmetsp:Transcript_24917/g.42933  ORF Transcript_24917/g.42933 Transcript_24917/m.42933 type:complete len:215 (+) Transcript_24917:2105-2749(+)
MIGRQAEQLREQDVVLLDGGLPSVGRSFLVGTHLQVLSSFSGVMCLAQHSDNVRGDDRGAQVQAGDVVQRLPDSSISRVQGQTGHQVAASGGEQQVPFSARLQTQSTFQTRIEQARGSSAGGGPRQVHSHGLSCRGRRSSATGVSGLQFRAPQSQVIHYTLGRSRRIFSTGGDNVVARPLQRQQVATRERSQRVRRDHFLKTLSVGDFEHANVA